jgi:hypothetical protein
MNATLRNGLLAAATAGVMIAGAGAAQAFSLTSGSHTWHFTNWETRVTGQGDVLEGLIRVDQIFNNDTGNTVFSTNPGEELVGYFTGLTVQSITEAPGAPFSFTGGEIFLYTDTTPDFNPSKDPTVGSGAANLASDSPGVSNIAPDAAPTDQAPLLSGAAGAGVTDGTLWAHIVFDAGISLADPTATLAGGIRPVVAVDDGLGSPALQGDGSGFMSIVAGSAYDQYNTNGYNGGLSDFRLDNTFFITNGPAAVGPVSFDNTTNGWDTHSDDPVKALAIPEPATIGLMGMGLFGIGVLQRRRRKAAA